MANFADPNQDTNAQRVVLANGSASEPSLVWSGDLTKGLYFDDADQTIKSVGFDGGGGDSFFSFDEDTSTITGGAGQAAGIWTFLAFGEHELFTLDNINQGIDTPIRFYDPATDSVQQVLIGPNNSGPGGAGRALYIANS